MKMLLAALALSLSIRLVSAQTIPLDPSAPVRGGSQGQTTVPPLNPALNQSTIQGPPSVQRTPTNRDAQPSQLPPAGGFAPGGTPEASPTAVPDVREQGVFPSRVRRESSDVVPTRDRRTRSSNVGR